MNPHTLYLPDTGVPAGVKAGAGVGGVGTVAAGQERDSLQACFHAQWGKISTEHNYYCAKNH